MHPYSRPTPPCAYSHLSLLSSQAAETDFLASELRLLLGSFATEDDFLDAQVLELE